MRHNFKLTAHCQKMNFKLLCLTFLCIAIIPSAMTLSLSCESTCRKNFRPVCGEDGETYSNKCLMSRCARVRKACNGKCPCKKGSCTIPEQEKYDGENTFHLLILSRIFAPVCGKDGRTYINEYDLKCKKAKKRCEGECPCKDRPRCRIPK